VFDFGFDLAKRKMVVDVVSVGTRALSKLTEVCNGTSASTRFPGMLAVIKADVRQMYL
jgi:hypothetical protein